MSSIKGLNSTLNINTQNIESSFKKLSSGKRINSAADDPAGLAVAEKLLSEAKLYEQASQNAGYSQLAGNIAQGALSQVSDITTRMSELATQAANGTLSDDQRSSLNNEYQSLRQEIDRISATTEFNGVQVLSGESQVSQVGIDSSGNSQISSPSVSLSTSGVAAGIGTIDQARAAIESVKTLTQNVTDTAGQIGAYTNRLAISEQNNLVAKENVLAAESRIRDVDYAAEVANYTKAAVLQKANQAMSAQANKLSADTVMKLLS